MYCSIILAAALGVYGQWISYYITEIIVEISPLYYLTTITMISILLFLATPILAYTLNKDSEKNSFAIPNGINGCIDIPITFWSLFVLVMWWG